MKKLFAFLVLAFLLSCNDGDIYIPEFDFSGSSTEMERCDEDRLIIYSINDTEVLVIELNEDNDTLTTTEGDYSYTLSTTGHKITYRTLDAAPGSSYFCQSIPPTAPTTITEWLGTGGDLTISVTLDRADDNDSVDEENPLDDTDGDGRPNYLDDDDDGDRIPTSEEKGKDTDSDGIPDYLDTDDDGDGTPTLNESKTDDADGDGIPNYLDADSQDSINPDREPITNTITEYYKSRFVITNLQFKNDSGNTMQYDVFEQLSSLEKTKAITN